MRSLISGISVLLMIATVNATTVTAVFEEPIDGSAYYWSADISAYKWNIAHKHWSWYDWDYVDDDSRSYNVSLELRKGRYYFISSLFGGVGDIWFNDEEYYDDAYTFRAAQKVIISGEETAPIDLGVIDFDPELPDLLITKVRFADGTKYLPEEGGKVKPRITVTNRLETPLDLKVWGDLTFRTYWSDLYREIRWPAGSPKSILVAPGENVFGFNFDVPAEATNGSYSFKVFMGDSFFDTDSIWGKGAAFYKGVDHSRKPASSKITSTRSSESSARLIPKIISADGKVLEWMELPEKE